MVAINIGNTYKIYDNSVKTYSKLPAKTYVVRFDKLTGFELEEYFDIGTNEEKIYGVQTEKVNKVLRVFEKFNRNLGVILSGDKGIGKSLFAKMLAGAAVEKGYPVIVVDTYYSGVASYIESIDQEVVVLFDEFDKTFGGVKTKDGESDAQTSLLSLFDGISQGKKLFIVTCNELNKISSYLVNRPGRFHYHFRFDYPSSEEIREYLRDKLEETYYGEIEKVVMFSRKVDLNYDCLRAIAFELNFGDPFEDAIKDLNIINLEAAKYDVALYFKNGEMLTARGVCIDLFNRDDSDEIYMYDSNGNNLLDIKFDHVNCVYDPAKGNYIVDGNNIHISYNDYDDDYQERVQKLKESGPLYATIVRKAKKQLHYLSV